jgi:hypothetical protein
LLNGRGSVSGQLARRNITPENASYLRGRRHNAERKPSHRPEKAGQSDQLTSKRLAKEFGVGEKTVRRDSKFANAVDGLYVVAGPPAHAVSRGPAG